jgi:hypothetical protein
MLLLSIINYTNKLFQFTHSFLKLFFETIIFGAHFRAFLVRAFSSFFGAHFRSFLVGTFLSFLARIFELFARIFELFCAHFRAVWLVHFRSFLVRIFELFGWRLVFQFFPAFAAAAAPDFQLTKWCEEKNEVAKNDGKTKARTRPKRP